MEKVRHKARRMSEFTISKNCGRCVHETPLNGMGRARRHQAGLGGVDNEVGEGDANRGIGEGAGKKADFAAEKNGFVDGKLVLTVDKKAQITTGSPNGEVNFCGGAPRDGTTERPGMGGAGLATGEFIEAHLTVTRKGITQEIGCGGGAQDEAKFIGAAAKVGADGDFEVEVGKFGLVAQGGKEDARLVDGDVEAVVPDNDFSGRRL